MQDVVLHCRNCNQRIHVRKTFGKQYGTPIKLCPNCSEPYLDARYIEIGVQGVRRGDTWKVSPRSIILLIVGCLTLLFGYISDNADSDVFTRIGGIILAVGIIAAIYNIANHGNRLENIENERAESIKRLENPEYVKLLKRAGIIKEQNKT
jgi:hypothetical protein